MKVVSYEEEELAPSFLFIEAEALVASQARRDFLVALKAAALEAM